MTGAEARAVGVATLGDLARHCEAEALIWWSGERGGRFVDARILAAIAEARQRFDRFAPVLKEIFASDGWDGTITSRLMAVAALQDEAAIWVKCDHALPVAGSVKARGGIHEVLKYVERLAELRGVHRDAEDFVSRILAPGMRAWMAEHRIAVGSTGNLGYAVGVAARAFGLQAEVHMSADAKAWKKDRLSAFGVDVVEHRGDFSEAVAQARRVSSGRPDCHFVDDENSLDLLVGYAVAAAELAGQLDEAGLSPSRERPLAIYVPCGVGGAAGGIAIGLKAIFGDAVLIVIVEPVASACMMAARINGNRALPVYECGLDNRTIADGLAVPCASQLVLDHAGVHFDVAVAVSDRAMVHAARHLWKEAGLRLEPSAAAGFAARCHLHDFPGALQQAPQGIDFGNMTEVVWATGGDLMPDAEFSAMLGMDVPDRRHGAAIQ